MTVRIVNPSPHTIDSAVVFEVRLSAESRLSCPEMAAFFLRVCSHNERVWAYDP